MHLQLIIRLRLLRRPDLNNKKKKKKIWDLIVASLDEELDDLEANMGLETTGEGMPSYLQLDNEPEELNFPSAPSRHASRVNNQSLLLRVLSVTEREAVLKKPFKPPSADGYSNQNEQLVRRLWARSQRPRPVAAAIRRYSWLPMNTNYSNRCVLIFVSRFVSWIDVFNRVLDVYQCSYFTSHVCSLLDLSMPPPLDFEASDSFVFIIDCRRLLLVHEGYRLWHRSTGPLWLDVSLFF
ncbi:hypothetical protein L6452_38661 [Arctium lappa]|uniref:Uncharacterized protein n=1 Tax=Arctium lappa TaxID=4217 RepID=A0ACB8XPR0_ARCLA|nr:hypothetical protein L6452_38661 [Arctium lappa]